MAQLPASGPLGLNAIRNLKPAVSPTLQTLEQNYMGAAPQNPVATGICMPEDIIYVSNADNNTGTPASSVDGPWNYSKAGDYPAGIAWGPHSIKEFYSAYTGRPTVSLNKQNTGTAGNFNLLITIGGEFAKTSANYYICINGGSWQNWPGDASGNYSINKDAGTYTVQVKDLYHCGAGGQVSSQITYP